MKKILSRFIISIIFIILIFLIYLSTIGIKTEKLNNQISNQVKNINENFDIELKDIIIILDPIKFKINIKTFGTNLNYKGKAIQLEKIKSSVSLKSLINNEFSLKELKISTKSVKIKNLISLIRLLENDPKLFIVEKFVEEGFLIADIDLEFDQNGNIKKNYNINGFIKQGKINYFKKYSISNIDLIFNFKKDQLNLNDLKLSFNNKNLEISSLKAKKEKEIFQISGNLFNKQDTFDRKEIYEIFKDNFLKLPIDKINFSSENLFYFEVDKKFKFQNLILDSKIDIKELNLKNEFKLDKFFPKLDKEIIFKNHKINLKYNKETWNIEGLGEFLMDKEDKIEYDIKKKGNNIYFKTFLKINKSPFKIDLLNYKKKDKSNLEIIVNGSKDLKDNLNFKKISLLENDNKIIIQNFSISNTNEIEKLEKINFDYEDQNKLRNNISIIKKEKNYLLSGATFNANKLIDSLLNSKHDSPNIFKGDTRFDIKIDKTYLDKDNIINSLNGYLLLRDDNLLEADLSSKFSNNKDIKFTVKSNGNEKITTLFSGEAKPLVNRYKFIKGFDEGSLDFYSIKKDNKTNSTLKIYDFKLKELPALTKILTLASLQGIADLLSGEGIRFNEFEMNFTNSGQLMTIDEIYAIGPAISILMSGYLEDDKLVSLRGTLVPATTLNKTIGSIPILGNILVGKKTGEGVFGVSFKIKGPPKKLETSVNPIKTLTPRFITRTLEKIKKN